MFMIFDKFNIAKCNFLWFFDFVFHKNNEDAKIEEEQIGEKSGTREELKISMQEQITSFRNFS